MLYNFLYTFIHFQVETHYENTKMPPGLFVSVQLEGKSISAVMNGNYDHVHLVHLP